MPDHPETLELTFSFSFLHMSFKDYSWATNRNFYHSSLTQKHTGVVHFYKLNTLSPSHLLESKDWIATPSSSFGLVFQHAG